MTRRTKDDWKALIQQQADSQLSVAEFCQQHNLGQTYFYKRKSDLKRLSKASPKEAFIKVSKPNIKSSQNLAIRMQYQQSRISVPVSVSPLWLAELIKALA
jgi:hypothetical protein